MNDWFEAEQRIERAQQLSESQRWVEALTEIEAALEINPNNASWNAQRGLILEELDRSEEAAEAYEHSLELEPGDPDVSVAYGAVLTRLGRLARALEVFEDLAKTCPDFEPAYCHRIRIYTELGRHDQAEEMFYLAQELNEECPQCFFNMGASLAARGRTDRALYCWQRVLELEPNCIGVNRHIAQAYRAQGQLDRAREYLLAEVRNDPGNTDLLCELAELTLEAGQVGAAVAKYAQILELDPDHRDARFALGKIWLLRDRPARALECFEALDSCPEESAELPDFEWRVGEALFQLGRFAEAAERLARAAGEDDANPKILMLLGNSLLADKKPDQATDWYRRILALEARNSLAHHKLGVCLFQLGRHAAGLDHCLEAIRYRPDFVVAMYNAAVAHIHLGHWREARRMLERALRHDPRNENLQQLAKRLWRYRLRRHVDRLLATIGLVRGRPLR